MPIETTTNLAAQPLATPRAARIADANEGGGASHSLLDHARRCVERALAASRAVATRVWPKKMPRPGARTMTVLGWIAVIALALYAGLATTV